MQDEQEDILWVKMSPYTQAMLSEFKDLCLSIWKKNYALHPGTKK